MGKIRIGPGRRVLAARLCRDVAGATFPVVAILATVLIGVGALVIDLGRLMNAHTEFQSAADAAALAGARELNLQPGALARARAAAQLALANKQAFATGGTAVTISTTDCATAPSGASCMQFLSGLPADDDDPITAAYVTADDAEASFLEVRLGTQTVPNFLIQVLGGGDSTSTRATAVAGNDITYCNTPPLWMCNPTEPAGNTDPTLQADTNFLSGRQVRAVFQGGGGAVTPGNFGFLCPSGNDGDVNCGGNEVGQYLASQNGTCIGGGVLTTKTGMTLGPARNGVNVRMDEWGPQSQDQGNNAWRTQDAYQPAVNVTQGRKPPNGANGNQTKCEHTALASNRAMGLPRDSCHLSGTCTDGGGRVGDGTWDHAEYFRINHGGNGTEGWRPTGWPAGASGAPTRFQVYRYEIENNQIVQPGETIQNIPSGTTTTLENGGVECFQGTPPTNTYDYFPGMQISKDMLEDRRLVPMPLANCNALGNPGGKFSFSPSEFVYAFITETMGNPSEADLYVEILGTADEGTLDELARDVVRIYRR